MKKLFVIIACVLCITESKGQSSSGSNTYNPTYYLGWGAGDAYELNLKVDGINRIKIYDNPIKPPNKGYVGIGNFNNIDPTSQLHLNNDQKGGIYALFNNNKAGVFGNEYGFLVGLGGGGQDLDGVLASQSGGIKFFTKCCNIVQVGQVPFSPYPPNPANGNLRMYISPTGNVGIDAQDPSALFQIGNGNQKIAFDRMTPTANNKWSSMYLSFNGVKISSAWKFESDGAHNAGTVITTTPNGGLRISNVQESNTPTTSQIVSEQTIINNTAVELTNQGQLLIGNPGFPNNNNVNDLKVIVKGGILCQKVKVALDGTANWNWPDYVFEKSYKLQSLNEIEEYILMNKHLPDVPSACEVENDGIDLAQMNAKLLQKVEELTLHLINQGKEIENLKNAVNANR